MATYSNTAREVEMPNGDVVVIHNAPTGGENTTSNIKKFKYDDNGHVTESTAANATDLNLNSYSTPTTGSTDIGTSDAVQTAIGKLDHQSKIDQTNILYGLQTGVKNIIKLQAGTYKDNVATFTVTNDGEVLVSSTSSSTSALTVNTMDLPAGDYVYWYDNTASSGACDVRLLNGTTRLSGAFTLSSAATLSIAIFSYATNSNVSIKPMLCTANAWAQEPNVYRKPSLPNYDLTQLEAEDRASLAEVVDASAKNKLKLDKDAIKSLNSGGSWSGYAYTPTTAPNLTVTINDDSTVTLNGSTSSSLVTVALERKASSGFQGYVLSGSKANTKLVYQLAVSPYTVYATADGVGSDVIANYTDGSTIQLSLQVVANSTFSNTIITPMICTQAAWNVSQKYVPYRPNWDLVSSVAPFYSVPINHNMIYRGNNLGASLTDAQHTALSSGNFTDLYLGDYWTKSVTIPDFYELTTAEPSDWATAYTSYYTKSGDTYTPVSGDTAPTWAANTYYERLVMAQTVTLKAVIADFDTFYAGYASGYAAINSHHAAVIVTGFNNVVWNKTNSTAGGYVASLINKWLVGSVLPQIETWFGSAKVLSHQKLLTNAITGDAASGWAWSSQKISLLSECQLYGMKVWGGSKATNGAYEPGEAFKKLDVFNHIDANLLFSNQNIWCRDIASAVWAAYLNFSGFARYDDASSTGIAPAALILLS